MKCLVFCVSEGDSCTSCTATVYDSENLTVSGEPCTEVFSPRCMMKCPRQNAMISADCGSSFLSLSAVLVRSSAPRRLHTLHSTRLLRFLLCPYVLRLRSSFVVQRFILWSTCNLYHLTEHLFDIDVIFHVFNLCLCFNMDVNMLRYSDI